MDARPRDAVVVGAGIVGLALARALRARRPAARVLVLEKEPAPGRHASGRNSGVLHSGVYYPPDTLKARFCREGARRMKDFAREHGVALGEWGKVILAASPDEEPALDKLLANARAGGVRAEKLDAAGVRALEPAAAPGLPGLHCPDTAVIDAKGVMKTLARLLKDGGVEIETDQEVAAVDLRRKELRTARGERVAFGHLFNCAGAHADRVARLCGLGTDYALVPFKGLYRRVAPERAASLRGSLYPVPDPSLPFLGVHLTRSVTGEVFAGPTAIPALGRENYGLLAGARPFEAALALGRLAGLFLGDAGFRRLVRTEAARYLPSNFLAAARRLMPSLTAADLLPSGKAGIRPQLVHRKERRLVMDFVVERSPESTHVLNAISPAFTSAFPFAEWIAGSF